MNIVVLGPGAIGTLWAYHFKKAGHNVSVVTREKTPTTSLSVDEMPIVHFENATKAHLSNADLLLVTVKAWQIESALLPTLQLLNPDCILVPMHNGMGAIDALDDQTKAHPIVLATTTHGALKTNASHVKHTGLGATQLGGYNERGKQCAFLAEVFDHSLPQCSWIDNIHHALWRKLAINCAINPLSAIDQCKNGELAQPKYSQKLAAIVSEVCAVMNAESIDVDYDQLMSNVLNVIEATAANRSSMHQDIVYKRKTEIEFITGYLIQRANQHGVSVNENLAVYNQVKAIEKANLTND